MTSRTFTGHAAVARHLRDGRQSTNGCDACWGDGCKYCTDSIASTGRCVECGRPVEDESDVCSADCADRQAAWRGSVQATITMLVESRREDDARRWFGDWQVDRLVRRSPEACPVCGPGGCGASCVAADLGGREDDLGLGDVAA